MYSKFKYLNVLQIQQNSVQMSGTSSASETANMQPVCAQTGQQKLGTGRQRERIVRYAIQIAMPL